MSTTVMSRIRKRWRSEEATIRFMIDDDLGVAPEGSGSSLIDSA
jgi:hypothetical protein